MTIIGVAVSVLTGMHGIPERFVWNATTYRVTDTPTRLDLDYATITHPPAVPLGWRFQGTSDTGETRMFDVMFEPVRGEWLLLHTYE
ncbi:MAG TPA: hypothetical protein VFQ54_03135 [Thermomicrobiales bacterium]|nr:hypothetical protein [Thermomicrobiales bacterium]